MDVCVGGPGHVVMDDYIDARNVETAGGDICCDEDGVRAWFGFGEALDGAKSGLLGHLGVESVDGQVEVLEHG